MIKKLLFALIILLSFDCVNALDFCTASKEYLEYQSLTEAEKKDILEPIYCNEIIGTSITNYSMVGSNLASLFPTLASPEISDNYYSSVALGYDSKPENQYQTGMCWAFSAISSVEINARKNNAGNFNFSEVHMGYSLLGGTYKDELGMYGRYNADSHNGGKITYAPTYFFNSYGQYSDTDMPMLGNIETWLQNLKPINSNQYTHGTNMISIESYYLDNIEGNSSCTNNEIAKMKEKILRYGAIQATIHMDTNLFHDANNDYYLALDNNLAVNHGVTIVGWDDTIPKTYFGASRDGGWIVKNSWGETWSNDGYFYISYDDSYICKLIAIYGGVSTKTFDYTYKASDVVGTFDFSLTGKNYISTKFTKQSSEQEKLERISYPIGDNSTYNVYLSLDNSLDKTKWQLIKSGTSNAYGIDSVNLDDVYIDDDFTVIVESNVSTGKISSLLTMCLRDSDTSHMNINSNTNYISIDGSSWEDMATYECEPNIYAYTTEVSNLVNLEIKTLNEYDDVISIEIERTNVNVDDITYTIKDKNNNDVTHHFTIVPNYDNNEIYLISDNTISGNFTVIITYNDINVSNNFSLVEQLISNSENLTINPTSIAVTIATNDIFTYEDLLNSLNIKNTAITVNDSKGNNVTNTNSPIGTDSTIITNSSTYKIVVLGDLNKDAKLTLADVAYLFQYVTEEVSISNQSQISAAKVRKKNNVTLGDVAKLFQYVTGEINSL